MATAVQEPTDAPEAVASEATAAKMFKYSAFVDVGEGAAECEHARDGACEDTEHFHAWCRLPNPFQHQDIRQKGMAAKARKIRELRDPESDAAVILDAEIGAMDDDVFRSQLIDELVASEWAPDYLEAQRLTDEEERFEHIAQDREELGRLARAETEGEHSEEYERLTRHIEGYLDALRANLDEIQRPKRGDLDARSTDALVQLVRTRRVDDQSDGEFLETYNAWMWFVGTFKVAVHPSTGRPHLPMWTDIGHRDRPAAGTMFGEAPEVIDALKRTFNDLQLSLQRGSSGNS